jgi:hypothetical protein
MGISPSLIYLFNYLFMALPIHEYLFYVLDYNQILFYFVAGIISALAIRNSFLCVPFPFVIPPLYGFVHVLIHLFS